MVKIALLGDSHSASFRLGWNKLAPSLPDVSIRFFADRSDKLAELEVRGGKLVPTTDRLRKVLEHTSGGLNSIDPSAYDAILLVGMYWAYPQDPPGHFSRAVIQRTLLDFGPKSLAFRLAQQIRQVSAIPVFLAHQPLLAWAGAPDEHDPEAGPYSQHIGWLNDRIFSEPGVRLLEQPHSTITHSFYTRPEFTVGSTRLDIGDFVSGQEHPEADRKHMNDAYGAICLQAHLASIAAPSRAVSVGSGA